MQKEGKISPGITEAESGIPMSFVIDFSMPVRRAVRWLKSLWDKTHNQFKYTGKTFSSELLLIVFLAGSFDAWSKYVGALICSGQPIGVKWSENEYKTSRLYAFLPACSPPTPPGGLEFCSLADFYFTPQAARR